MCFCRSHYLLLAVVVLLGLTTLLGGCGAKGELYLPKGQQSQQSAPVISPASAPASIETTPQQP